MQLQKAFQLMPCMRKSRLKAKRLLEMITAGTSAGAANGHAQDTACHHIFKGSLGTTCTQDI